jgi:hypothetical protein
MENDPDCFLAVEETVYFLCPLEGKKGRAVSLCIGHVETIRYVHATSSLARSVGDPEVARSSVKVDLENLASNSDRTHPKRGLLKRQTLSQKLIPSGMRKVMAD